MKFVNDFPSGLDVESDNRMGTYETENYITVDFLAPILSSWAVIAVTVRRLMNTIDLAGSLTCVRKTRVLRY